MSRARPIHLPDQTVWVDVTRNSEKASEEQLELLAVVEDVDLDDLLDAVLTQGEVVRRLRLALGQDPIPTDVLERRQKWREARQQQPQCRKCGKEGDSTKHHFVPKWILRELRDYASKWADRSKSCIPACIDCHRKLHLREDGRKSIAEFLSDKERDFAEAALSALAEERPKLLLLIARGDSAIYETQLVRDWISGRFAKDPAPYARHLRAV
jgi:hypothetical protein